jgi:hypothetical protein
MSGTLAKTIDQLVAAGLLAPERPFQAGPPPLAPLPAGSSSDELLAADRADDD